MSRDKGARGEREVAEIIRRYGFDAQRGALNGILSAEDVRHSIPGAHIECKRAERLLLPSWLMQAERDAAPGKNPVVVYRSNGQPWRAVVPFEYLLDLQRRAAAFTAIQGSNINGDNSSEYEQAENQPPPDGVRQTPVSGS